MGPLIAHVNLARGFRGGERQTELLLRGLAARGWRQRLVARRGEALLARCADVPGLEAVPVAGNVLAAALALRGADLAHAHEARALQAAGLAALLAGVPCVVTRRVQQGPSHTALNRWLYRRAARVVVLSDAIAASLHALDPALAVTRIPDAHGDGRPDPARARELRAAWGGGFVVGHVGALVDSHKGQRQLVSLAARLRDAHPDVRVVLVGGGRDEGDLRAQAAGLPNLVFTGEVRDVPTYLAAFDLFIYPSRHEGMGSALLDAMAAGLPIVATRVGGIPEVVRDGEHGRLCAVDDVAGLAAAVLAFRADPALRARTGAANRAAAAAYSPESMTARYMALYDAVLGRAAT